MTIDRSGKFREEIGALLRHDFAVFAEFFQGVERRRTKDAMRDLVIGSVHLSGDGGCVGGVAFGEFLAGSEMGLEDLASRK